MMLQHLPTLGLRWSDHQTGGSQPQERARILLRRPQCYCFPETTLHHTETLLL